MRKEFDHIAHKVFVEHVIFAHDVLFVAQIDCGMFIYWLLFLFAHACAPCAGCAVAGACPGSGGCPGCAGCCVEAIICCCFASAISASAWLNFASSSGSKPSIL